MSELAVNRALLLKYNKTMTIFLMISLAVNLFVGTGFLVYVLRNRTPIIVYEDGGELTVLKKQDYHLNEKLLEDFVRMIAREYLSFSPVSLPRQIDGIKEYVAAAPVKIIMDEYTKNQETIQQESVFHQFTIDDIKIIKKSDPFRVEAGGVRTIYVSGKENSKKTVYIFEVKKITPTDSNPWGLIVSQIVEKKVKTKD